MVDSLSRFSEFIDPFVLDLPSGTLAFEEEGKVRYTHTLLTQHPLIHTTHTTHTHTTPTTHSDGVHQHSFLDV